MDEFYRMVTKKSHLMMMEKKVKEDDLRDPKESHRQPQSKMTARNHLLR